jgi:hypothetical protein
MMHQQRERASMANKYRITMIKMFYMATDLSSKAAAATTPAAKQHCCLASLSFLSLLLVLIYA